MKVVKGIKGLVVVALLALVSVTAAEAAPQVGFYSANTVNKANQVLSASKGFLGTDTLELDEFYYSMDLSPLVGNEEIVIDSAQMATIGFTFYDPEDDFSLIATFNGFVLGEMVHNGFTPLGTWEVNFTPEALASLNANKGGTIGLTLVGTGNVKISNYAIGGTGTVVPEPLSLFLLGSSLAGFGVWKKKELFSSND